MDSQNSSAVTDEPAATRSSAGKRTLVDSSHVIKVQPLKRSEMQARTRYILMTGGF